MKQGWLLLFTIAAAAAFLPPPRCVRALSTSNAPYACATATAQQRAPRNRLVMSRRSRRRKRGAEKAIRSSDLDTVAENVAALGVGRRGVVPPPLPFRYLCVCDVEATCDEFVKGYVHEIIEFPVVVVDLEEATIVDEFHSYVQPTVNTTLTPFCTQLTGITQDKIDGAPTLPEVLQTFEAWRSSRAWLLHDDERKTFAFAADGPFDMRFFLHGECARKGISKRAYFDKWVNVKALFADFYHVRSCKIHKMLSRQGLKFEGRLHSGIDDTRNIARIAIRMRQDGSGFYVRSFTSDRNDSPHVPTPTCSQALAPSHQMPPADQ
jgi:inhibitor of KinA sporulation pathway (predicted exonuclease)